MSAAARGSSKEGILMYAMYGLADEKVEDALEDEKMQKWYDDIQEIVSCLDGYDEGLGEFLLDHCTWDNLFDDGLTPQQAVDAWMHELSTNPDVFKKFKQQRGYEK
jgi:hypothetical protein